MDISSLQLKALIHLENKEKPSEKKCLSVELDQVVLAPLLLPKAQAVVVWA